MVASPEICRANGRLSRGHSGRGKAIAAKKRHTTRVTLAEAAITGDEGLRNIPELRGLIDGASLKSPTEQLLISKLLWAGKTSPTLGSWGPRSANLEMIRRESSQVLCFRHSRIEEKWADKSIAAQSGSALRKQSVRQHTS